MADNTIESNVLETVSLANSDLYKLAGDIVKIKFREKVELDQAGIQSFQDAKMQLAEGRPYYFLVVSPQYASVTKEACEYSASEEANRNVLAKAIVISNLSMRLMASLFITFNKPPVPHRIFSNEKSALEWFEYLKSEALIPEGNGAYR